MSLQYNLESIELGMVLTGKLDMIADTSFIVRLMTIRLVTISLETIKLGKKVKKGVSSKI